MIEEQNRLQEYILKQCKILKLKSIRAWHRFDKQTGTTRFLKKMALAAALKTIATLMPNAQLSLHAQNVSRKIPRQELLANATMASNSPNYEEFIEYSRPRMAERQACFARELYETLRENFEEVQDGAKHGRKAQTLKNLFGKDVDTRYYCAISGLRSLEQTIEKKGYPEYDFLLKCIANPHACLSVISSLEKNFGPNAKTNNIRNKLRDELKKNSSAVCIAVVNTKQNTSSGKHFVFVLPNKVVVDSLVNESDTLKGKVISFNIDKIAPSDSYFTGTRNSGYLFNITEMSEPDLMMLFYNKYVKENNRSPQNSLPGEEYQPLSLVPKPRRRTTKKQDSAADNVVLWQEVGLRANQRS